MRIPSRTTSVPQRFPWWGGPKGEESAEATRDATPGGHGEEIATLLVVGLEPVSFIAHHHPNSGKPYMIKHLQLILWC